MSHHNINQKDNFESNKQLHLGTAHSEAHKRKGKVKNSLK